jgi:hypothetical protein
MQELKLKTLMYLNNPQKRGNVVNHTLMCGNISKGERYEMMVVMMLYVIIVRNVISKVIKGALAL